MNEQMLKATYDLRLVALSVGIAMCAAYAALDLAGRTSAARGRARFAWLTGGAVAMGSGIWSMHYIGMLAFRLPIPVRYDWPLVLLSLLAAIQASAIALFVVSRRKMGWSRACMGSLFMGGGIAAMHYIGMGAMRLAAMCHYSVPLVALSVILAIAISFVALWLTFQRRGDTRSWGWRKAISALVMGAAIPVMHYTGMAAASFVPAPLADEDLIHALSISTLGLAGISVVTFMVLGIAILTSLVDRRFSVQALELESSEQRSRQIFETALDAFVGMDSNGLITDWNAQAVTTFGWSRSETIGQALSQVIIPERYRDAHKNGLRRFLASGEGPVLNKRIEISALHRNGHEFPIELTISALRTGETHSFAAFLRDITDRKRVEEEREKAKQAAETANRAKSEFLANMSHEIRTPMNGIIGMTELALETELTRDQHEFLSLVKTSADSLLTVINDILDFSKIEAGKLDLDAIEFDLRDNLGDTLKPLAVRAHEKGLELTYDIRADAPEMLIGDPGRLRQIIGNLVGNSIKFTEFGEVNVQVATISRGKDCVELQFSVRDTGIGIPKDKQKTIFEPFVQADGSTTRKYGGTGLGLTISSVLVAMMGGRIWVDGEPGQGSTFHFTASFGVPQEQRLQLAKAQPNDLKGLRVLVVDDNATNRRILQGMVTNWGMKPYLADSGRAALAAMREEREKGLAFPLVLLDAQMPDVDGFALAAQISRDSKLAGATIMMLTSGGQRGDASRCRDLGISAYLLKPIKQSELLAAILSVLVPKVGETKSRPLVTRHTLRKAQKSLRILLAEDNRVNQRLAVLLLQKHGHQVAVAGNGREALAALEKEPFDVILMDMQMPEMDGFEAAEAIREKEKSTGQHIPIVALTAYALKGDRERCLAAGMDAYVSKPIKPEELFETIAPMLGRQADAATSGRENGGSAAAGEGEPAVDREALEGIVGGDLQLLEELCGLFSNDYPPLLAQLREASARGDASQVRFAAHTLKGMVSNFSANGAQQLAQQIELSAESGNTSVLPLCEALSTELNRVADALRDACKRVAR